MSYKVNRLILLHNLFANKIFKVDLGIVAEPTEIALQQRLAQGDEQAFAETFNHFFKPLTVFAKKFVGDLSVAEDLVQDIFVKLYETKASLQFHTSLKAFLYQSTRNKCIDYLRAAKTKNAHQESIALLLEAEQLEVHDTMVQTELEQRVYQAIDSLPEQCQRIFKLSRLEGKRNSEIAEQLKISKRTVETQISNALKKLRTDVLPLIKSLIIIGLSIIL